MPLKQLIPTIGIYQQKTTRSVGSPTERNACPMPGFQSKKTLNKSVTTPVARAPTQITPISEVQHAKLWDHHVSLLSWMKDIIPSLYLIKILEVKYLINILSFYLIYRRVGCDNTFVLELFVLAIFPIANSIWDRRRWFRWVWCTV